MLSFVLAVPGVNASAGTSASAVGAALAAATGASGRGVALQVLGVSTGGGRRLLAVEARVQAFSATITGVLQMNATLAEVVSDGTLTTALQAAGVNTTGAELPVPPRLGAQFHLALQCPDGAVDGNGTLLPNAAATTMLERLSPAALGASASLLGDFNMVGLGNIASVGVSLLATIGALACSLLLQHACACVHDGLTLAPAATVLPVPPPPTPPPSPLPLLPPVRARRARTYAHSLRNSRAPAWFAPRCSLRRRPRRRHPGLLRRARRRLRR